MIQVNVKQHDPNEAQPIESISLVYENENVLVLHVDLREKYRELSGFGGATSEGVQSFWIGMTEVQMKLPKSFTDPLTFAETSRYSIYVCVFRSATLEETLLWSAPEEKEQI